MVTFNFEMRNKIKIIDKKLEEAIKEIRKNKSVKIIKLESGIGFAKVIWNDKIGDVEVALYYPVATYKVVGDKRLLASRRCLKNEKRE